MRLREPDLAKILERTNPLPDTIVLSGIWLEQYEELNKIIENKLFVLSQEESDIEHFSNYTAQYKKIEQVTNILHILQLGLYVIIMVFLVSISIITYSIIWNFIYYYRNEIYITRLVWGSKVFIYGPFVLQGAIYSLISFLLSLMVFALMVQNVNAAFSELYFLHISYEILFLEMIVFIFMWWISWFFSSRKYLKE
jgi:cell division protein FtsX